MEKFLIPSKFELINNEEVHNTNFKKVKLYIQSDGTNYNGSSFTVDSMQDAIKTIDYIPILGYIKENDGIYDFDGHNISYDIHVDSNGETSILENFEEVPIGVVTSKGCHIEYVNEKNFLVAYGYIWSSYSNRGISILERDIEKEVSMEICVFEGDFNEKGTFEISKYEIQGVTVLGQDVPAAIEGAKIQMSFSKNSEYEEKVKELDELLQTFALKGGEDVEEKEMLEQPQEEEQQEPQNLPFAEEEEKEDVCPECGKPQDECECDKEDKEEEFQQEPEQVEEEKLYSQKEMDEAIANTKAEFSQAIAELEELRKFKAEYDKALEVQKLNDEMDNLLKQFNCDEELVKELREKVINKEISMEAFELQLWRNNQPIKKEFNKEKQSNKLPVMDSENKVSSVDELFNYYGIPKRK